MTNAYDAIIVGGGHNGLVSAAYLALGLGRLGETTGSAGER